MWQGVVGGRGVGTAQRVLGSSAVVVSGSLNTCTCDGRLDADAAPDGLSTPVVSNTSISVQEVPSFWWNHHEDEMPLVPDRQRTSKKPSRTRAMEWIDAVV